MKLEQVSVRSFGLLRNYTVSFESGLNIIEGGNETGKTTLAAFIRFMLYGFDENEGLLSEREKRPRCTKRTLVGQEAIRHSVSRRIGAEKGKEPREAPSCPMRTSHARFAFARLYLTSPCAP